MTRPQGLGRLCGELAAATDAPKSLEHPGPAQQGVERFLCASLRPECRSEERTQATQEAVSPFRSPSEEVCAMERQRNEAHFCRGECERDELKAHRALPCRRSEFLKSRASLEGLKKSRRRPAASLLRLAALSDFRPSGEGQTVFLCTNLLTRDQPSHSSPEVPCFLTGLERVSP